MIEWIAGKSVLIPAAGQGIARASALAFAAAGATVHATDINEAALAEIAGTPGIVTRKLNVLDDAAVVAVFAEIGKVDVLFNCAGFVHSGTILEMKEDDLDFAFDLNVRSMVRTISAMLPGMIAHGGGDRADQVGCRRLYRPRYSLQRYLPRHGGKSLVGRPHASRGQL